MNGNIVLEAENLKKHYEVRRGTFKAPAVVKALDGASFNLERGKTLAVVGESGCGKSTLLNILGLLDSPSDQLVEGAARALGHPIYKGAEPALESLLNRQSQRLNYAAVHALVGIDSEQATRILLDAEANHPNPKVRRLISARVNL